MTTEEWLAGAFKRDQDLIVDVGQLLKLLGRIASMGGDRAEYEDKAQHDPGYLQEAQ